jgi:peptidyl-prolyl cis-trans isomerase C
VRTCYWLAAVLAASVACQKTPASSSAAQAAAPASGAQAKPAATAAATSGGTAPQGPGLAGPPAPKTKPVPAVLPPICAHVNGEDVKKDDLELAVHNMELQAGRPLPAEQRDEVYRGMLDQMIAFRLLKQETQRRQVTATDAELDQAMKQVRSQFPTDAAFQDALKAQKITLDELRKETRSNLLISKMLDQEITPQLTVKPSEVSAFYEKNPDKFQQPETIRASHVLIAVPQNADATTRQKAREKAEDVLKQAKAGADFAKLAQTYSNDASKNRGGDLGYFPKGQMVPTFDAAAFALQQPGQLSGVVESPFGYHVIKLTDRKPAHTVPFGEVSSRIEQFLQQEMRSTKTREFVEGLKAKGKVEVLI